MKSRRAGLPLVLGCVVAGTVLWFLPPMGTLWAAAQAVPAWAWAGAVVALSLSYLMRALRLRDEWQGRVELPMREALRLSLLHSAALNLLPLRSGELGYPLLLRRHGVPLADAAASLLWLRVQDSVVLGSTAAAVLLLPLPLPLRLLVAAAVVGLVALALPGIASALLRRLDARPGPPARWQRALRPLLGVVRHGSVKGWVCTAMHWLAKLGTTAWLLQALIGLPALAAWCGAALGEAAGALPLQAPAGFGAFEAGVWLGALRGGAPVEGSTVLGAALNAHLFVLAFALLGAGLSQGSEWLVPQVRHNPS